MQPLSLVCGFEGLLLTAVHTQSACACSNCRYFMRHQRSSCKVATSRFILRSLARGLAVTAVLTIHPHICKALDFGLTASSVSSHRQVQATQFSNDAKLSILP